MRFRLTALVSAIAGLFLMAASAQAMPDIDPENTLLLELDTGGTVTIEMLPALAPAHVERIKKLTRDGFYDGVSFHRVIDGFMAQTGDPTGTGMGGSDLPDLRAEFGSAKFRRGTVGMARAGDPDSANSQFFIMFANARHMNQPGRPETHYTVWGEVVDGMEFVDAIPRTEPSDMATGKLGHIVKARIAADAKPSGTN